MMNKDSSLEDQVNQALDDSVENLSPDIRRSLNKIRIEACAKPQQKLMSWKVVGALSIFFAITMSWLFLPEINEVPEVLVTEVLLEDLEMLDDLEFVYWMAEQDDIASL